MLRPSSWQASKMTVHDHCQAGDATAGARGREGRTKLVLECKLHLHHVRLLHVQPADSLVRVHHLPCNNLQRETTVQRDSGV